MKKHFRSLSWLLSSFLLATGAFTATAAGWVSIPSSAPPGKILITGGGWSPFSTVVLKFEEPEGNSAEQFATVSADGTLASEYVPMTSGPCKVTVYDDKGNQIGAGAFLSQK